MTRPERTIGRTLGQLGLALLNATLLIALALALVVWQIVARVDALADRTLEVVETRIRPDAVALSLGRIEERLQALDGPGADLAPLRDELAGLRAELGALRGALAEWRGQLGQGQLLRALAAAVLDELGRRLSAAPG